MTLDGVHTNVMPFDDLVDKETGATRVRLVDTESVHYRVAREYMIRLEASDFESATQLDRLATAAKMTIDDFREEFASVALRQPVFSA